MTAWPPGRGRAIVALACACAAGGCTSVGDREHRFSDGWRLGTVEQIGADLEAPAWPSNDCRSAAGADNAPKVFASVGFAQMRHHRRRIVLLPAEPRFAAGDMVYFSVRDCAVPATLAARAGP